ncbi:MAG: hypothetical protein R6V83_10565 [Candidatus Thorarchaeota archaeon]
MVDKKNSVYNSIRLERDMSYPFPAIVGILSIFLFAAAYSMLGVGVSNRYVYLSPGCNSTAISEEMVSSVDATNTIATVYPIINCIYVVMLVAPLLIAFNLAQGYNNGQMRTLLSYPIKRRTVLFLKNGSVIFLMFSSGIIGTFFSWVFYFPFSIDLYSVMILIMTYGITVLAICSTCTLLAVLSRSARITAFVGVGAWMIVYTTFVTAVTHSPAAFLLFPLHLGITHISHGGPPYYYEETELFNVLLGSGITLVLVIVVLILSVIIIERQEI